MRRSFLKLLLRRVSFWEIVLFVNYNVINVKFHYGNM